MLRSVKEMKGFDIHALDDHIGHFLTLYFDDQSWQVRYFVIDTGNLLPGKKVLLAPAMVKEIDRAKHVIHVNLTKEQVLNCPPIDSDIPIEEQYKLLQKQSHALPYMEPWTGSIYPSGFLPKAEADLYGSIFDPHLRSCKGIMGYHVQAIDREMGHVEDFIFDHNWIIQYLVLNTRNFLPGKHVLESTKLVTRISCEKAKAYVALNSQEIELSPEFHIKEDLD